MIKQQYCTQLFQRSPLRGAVGPSVAVYINMTKTRSQNVEFAHAVFPFHDVSQLHHLTSFFDSFPTTGFCTPQIIDETNG